MPATPFLGQITMFGGNFPPRGWAFCDGQLLPISSNQALFSLLGTIYGGDGRTTFALPDLRGRVPVHAGDGPGLDPINQGVKAGTESRTLSLGNLPSHQHPLRVDKDQASVAESAGSFLASGEIYSATQDGSTLNASAVLNTGSNQAFNIQQPYSAIRFIIALQGVFPSRN